MRINLLAYPMHYIIIKIHGNAEPVYRKKGAGEMINFEKELKNFQPSLEVEEAEAAIYNHDLTDVTDIITEILRDVRQNGQQLGQ